ncbi:hypothetical protein [Rhodococcus sp. ACPA1]|uniref:hypothetical protein n=1 Tax=Rhodococcus sp. ACPA1 TaxID=2028572 RepID=UPI0015CD75AC|nr:hypothetical protein [Rhodococcus sp. ACPA1]
MHRRHAGADRQLSFRTADLDTAHAQVAETFAGHDVHADGRGDRRRNARRRDQRLVRFRTAENWISDSISLLRRG